MSAVRMSGGPAWYMSPDLNAKEKAMATWTSNAKLFKYRLLVSILSLSLNSFLKINHYMHKVRQISLRDSFSFQIEKFLPSRTRKRRPRDIHYGNTQRLVRVRKM